MPRERGAQPQKKSFQQSLDDIKEKMKEKRNKRLASACAANRGKRKITTNGPMKPFVLKSVQENNRALAAALQAEKEKLRRATDVILQLKRERLAMVFHLQLLKETAMKHQSSTPEVRRLRPAASVSSSCSEKKAKCDIAQDAPSSPPHDVVKNELPPTVGIRQRRKDRRAGYIDPADLPPLSPDNTDCQSTDLGLAVELQERNGETELGGCSRMPAEMCTERNDALVKAQPQQKTSEPRKKRRRNAKQEAPKQTPQFSSSSASSSSSSVSGQMDEPQSQASDPPGRGRLLQSAPQSRRVVAAPLKKPWENSRPRARSKSRDRANSRARAQAPPQPAAKQQSLNTSSNLNDTFDFDFEEAVHVTPFRAGGKTEARTTQETTEEDHPPQDDLPPQEGAVNKSNPQSDVDDDDDDDDDSWYVPGNRGRKKERRGRSPPRRARSKRNASKQRKEERPRLSDVKPKHQTEMDLSTTEAAFIPEVDSLCEDGRVPPELTSTEPSPQPSPLPERPPDSPMFEYPEPTSAGPAPQPSAHTQHQPDSPTFLYSEHLDLSGQSKAVHTVEDEGIENAAPMSCEMDEDLGWINEAPLCGLASRSKSLGTKREKSALKYRRYAGSVMVRSSVGIGLSDVTNRSPATHRAIPCLQSPSTSHPSPAMRRRRSKVIVDYKEPTINAKLRRGDRFTDTQFLRSPIFKQKSRRSSIKAKSHLGKYNESFVGCH